MAQQAQAVLRRFIVSQKDWERAADVHAMAQWAAGIRPDDIFQISFPFTLFFGGWGILQGAERLEPPAFLSVRWILNGK